MHFSQKLADLKEFLRSHNAGLQHLIPEKNFGISMVAVTDIILLGLTP